MVGTAEAKTVSTRPHLPGDGLVTEAARLAKSLPPSKELDNNLPPEWDPLKHLAQVCAQIRSSNLRYSCIARLLNRLRGVLLCACPTS